MTPIARRVRDGHLSAWQQDAKAPNTELDACREIRVPRVGVQEKQYAALRRGFER